MPKPLFNYEQLIATVGGGFDPPPKPKDSDKDGVPDNYDYYPYDDKRWLGTQ